MSAENLTDDYIVSEVAVIKSEGEIVDFADAKLEGSVNKAILAVGAEDVPVQVAEECVKYVIDKIRETVPFELGNSGFPPSVETKAIKSWVGEFLESKGLTTVKEAYEDYDK